VPEGNSANFPSGTTCEAKPQADDYTSVIY